jgi:LPLT family lysophospholipid transporter-like MFS transporter
MNLGFYIIMAAQFFSSLADNALLVAAIALLMQADTPTWLTPYLKFFFVISYVVLAPYVGAFADRMPNGWIEGLTVGSIILGTMLGGVLIHERVSHVLLQFDIPNIDTGIDTPPEAAIVVIVLVYAVAAAFNLYIPNTGVAMKPLPAHPLATLKDFSGCVVSLWKDRLGQISLAVTTLFWGAGATLQFIMIEWSRNALGYNLSQASILQGVCALGIAAGAVIASMHIRLDRAIRVIPLGITMGLVVILMVAVRNVWLAVPLIVLIGGLAGFFVVPMNALLQHRGHHLVGAGRSIAVQNFNENASILLMIAGYSLLLGMGMSIYWVIALFGLFVAGTMTLVLVWYMHNRRVRGEEMERLLAFARAEDHK